MPIDETPYLGEVRAREAWRQAKIALRDRARKLFYDARDAGKPITWVEAWHSAGLDNLSLPPDLAGNLEGEPMQIDPDAWLAEHFGSGNTEDAA